MVNTLLQQMRCKSSTMEEGEAGLAPSSPLPSIQTYSSHSEAVLLLRKTDFPKGGGLLLLFHPNMRQR